jgi:hypothetical protein
MLQALIKWPGSLSSLATWEDWEPLHQCFPRAAIWGHLPMGVAMSQPRLLMLLRTWWEKLKLGDWVGTESGEKDGLTAT